jgi:beta propeller repeat protein
MILRRAGAIRIVLLWLVVLCTVVMVSPAAGAGEVKIGTSESVQGHPSISGDRIVWQDNRNGNEDIYLWNLATQTETRITTDPNDQENPSISGNWIVWEDYRHGVNPEIYLYDLTTRTERQISWSGDENYQKQPAVDGTKVVYMDSMNGFYNIYMYNVETQRRSSLNEDSKTQWQPAISGDDVVWIDWTTNILYLYSISAGGQPIAVTDGNTGPKAPAVDNGRVVWADFVNGNDAGIFLYDRATGIKKWLTPVPTSQDYPVISGNTVVWVDDQAGTSNLYRYDLTTRQATQLTDGPGNQYSASIDGDRVVYVDDRGMNPHVYMSTISSILQPVVVYGQTKLPTDTDHDGLYEDLNGNGALDFNDVVIFFNQMDWIIDNEPVALFDFNQNGQIDFNDIVRVFNLM